MDIISPSQKIKRTCQPVIQSTAPDTMPGKKKSVRSIIQEEISKRSKSTSRGRSASKSKASKKRKASKSARDIFGVSPAGSVHHQISSQLKNRKTDTVWNIIKPTPTPGGAPKHHFAHTHPAAGMEESAGGVHRAGYIRRRQPAPRGWPVLRSSSRGSGRSSSRGRSPARR